MNRFLIAAVSLIAIALAGIPANAGDATPPKPKVDDPKETPKEAPKADELLLKDAVKGDPGLQSIQCMSFGPRGLLLIGDGKGGQLVAIQTADDKHLGEFKKLSGLNAKLAAAFKLRASDIAVTARCVNMASGCAYFALVRHDGRGFMLAQVKPDGVIEEVKLSDVSYASAKITLPKAAGAPIFNDVLFTEKQIVASATADAAFSAHVMNVPVPFVHNAQGAVVGCTSYHVTHGGWETKAPLEKLALWEEGGESYLVAGLTCTPVVKYALKDIKAGAQLKGKTPFDFGAGQQPIDIFAAGGWLYCCIQSYDAYVVRVSKDLVAGGKGLDTKAPTITEEKDDANVIAKAYAGLVQTVPGAGKATGVMQLSDTHMLVLREAKDDLELEAVALPGAK